MLLPTVLIIAVNLALGFVVAVGRERMLSIRATMPSEYVPADDVPAKDVHAASANANSPSESEPPAAEGESASDGPTSSQNADADADADAEGLATSPALLSSSEANAEPEAASTAADKGCDAAGEEPTSLPPDDAIEGAPATAGCENDMGSADGGEENATPGDEADGASDDASVDAEQGEPAQEPQTIAVEVAAENASADLPAEWFDVLADIEKEGYGKCQSFVEASTQVLRLEVGRYRGELVQLDGRIRAIFRSFDAAALAVALADLERVNAEWLERQGEAVGHLAARHDNLGDLQATGQRLEDVLLDQTAQIESSCTNVKQLDFAADRDGSQRRLLGEVCRLVDMAHALRDQLQESMLAIIVGENRVATLDRRLHLDALTGFVNRTGLEATLFEWWRDDPNRIRQLSVTMFDVVRIGRFNERYGVATGDGLLEAVGKIIDGTLRKKRGCDLTVRYSGQRFIVSLGDTGPRNATSAAERIRQMIAASTFEVGGEQVEVFVSCGVVEALHADDSRTMLRRLESAVAAAKKLGRTVTCLDEGQGPAAIADPPSYDAKGKIVRLETA